MFNRAYDRPIFDDLWLHNYDVLPMLLKASYKAGRGSPERVAGGLPVGDQEPFQKNQVFPSIFFSNLEEVFGASTEERAPPLSLGIS